MNMKTQRTDSALREPMTRTDEHYDLVVCGGGVGGVITAVMAALKGLSVALLDNKAGLGGNACSEIGLNVDGAHFFGFFVNMREGGPVEELKEYITTLDPYLTGGQNSTVMLFWCQEAGVRVFSELLIDEVATDGRRIMRVAGSQGGTERRLIFHARQFVDATGDGSIAAMAGAAFMTGREGRTTFGETLAPEKADTGIMGASLLFRASEKKEPTTFTRPTWAYEYRTEADLPHRLSMQKGPVPCGFWWIEFAGDHNDPIGEYEQIRVELSKCLYGAWAFFKNDPSRGMEKWSLDRVSISPAKRESRRVIGDVVIVEKDIVERTAFPDAIAYAGWNIDIHVPGGFKSPDKPNIHAYFPWVAPLPLRALYARDLDNLWLVGRDISVSHVASGATRLQATIGTLGHAVACAAAAAKRHGLFTRETAQQHIAAIQQEILRDGAYIPGIRNEDPLDQARTAVCTATSDQPLSFVLGETALPVGKGRTLSFPLTGGRVDKVTLPLRNPGSTPVEVRLFFSTCLHPNHASDLAPLASKTLRLEPGEQAISWSLNLTDLPDGLYAVGVTTDTTLAWHWQWPGRARVAADVTHEAALEWRASREVPCGCHTLVLDPEYFLLPQPDTRDNLYAVNKTIMMAPSDEDTRWVREKTNRVWRPQHQNGTPTPVPCIEMSPAPHPYAAGQVVSGVSHADRMPELWISDPAQPLPQAIELSWNTQRTLAEVRLVFDTDLDMSHPAFEPVDTLVKSYRLEVYTDGHWREVAREIDNRIRFRIHTFPALQASAVRLVVEAVHAGGKSARVFEMRCYA